MPPMETPSSSAAAGHWFVRNRLKLRQLLLLVAIHERASLNRAAEDLAMTQPAASKLLREIEAAVGVGLFDRSPRGMTANRYGEIMVRHARMALSGLNQAWDEIAQARAGVSGRVAVGAIMAAACGLVPDAIRAFQQDAALSQVSLVSDSSNVLLARLGRGELDIVVGRFMAESDKRNHDYEMLTASEAVGVLAPAGHPWRRRRRIDWPAWSEAAWAVPQAGGLLRHRFETMFTEHGVSPPIRLVEAADLQSMAALVRQAGLLAVLPVEAARQCVAQDLCVLAALPPCHMEGFGLITRQDRLLSPSAAKLLQALRTAGRQRYGPVLPRG